jgi:hypothetical protein
MGRPFRLLLPRNPRTFCHLRWRLTVLFLVTALLQQHHLFLVHRQSLAAKYAATDFHEAPPQVVRRANLKDIQDELLTNRGAWRVLGEGWEGKVFAYNGSVIKTFTPGRSPFRNCRHLTSNRSPENIRSTSRPRLEALTLREDIQASPAFATTSEKWPTEIAASLRFGGSILDTHHHDAANATFEGFLPVAAYFKASASPSQSPEWHLVTPLLKDGNLETLANKLALRLDPECHQAIDARYRPVFERLLTSMQRLHEEGYCHDDVKPANIFVRHENSWVLGDLGNVRHVAHPYHSSRLWKDNAQLEDCRANDVMRALKSYAKFVQISADNQDDFNKEFLMGKQPLSKLFWTASASAPSMSTARLRELSHIEHPRKPPTSGNHEPLRHTGPSPILALVSRSWALRRAVDHALQTRMGEKLARWWATVYVFGVPVTEGCDA